MERSRLCQIYSQIIRGEAFLLSQVLERSMLISRVPVPASRGRGISVPDEHAGLPFLDDGTKFFGKVLASIDDPANRAGARRGREQASTTDITGSE
jgi:hypothetical protein